MSQAEPDRRQLATRGARWAQSLAASLARARVAPNAISVVGVVVAGLGAVALAGVPEVEGWRLRALLLVAATAAIQLRLLCNLLDGLVAVEGGLRTRTGELFNDLPDRIADVLLIVAAGYGARETPYAIELGWLAAVLALLVAYVRVLGKSIGAGMHFLGPMAKQHRMALLSATCLAAAGFASSGRESCALAVGLFGMSAGCVATLVRRVRRIVARLESP